VHNMSARKSACIFRSKTIPLNDKHPHNAEMPTWLGFAVLFYAARAGSTIISDNAAVAGFVLVVTAAADTAFSKARRVFLYLS